MLTDSNVIKKLSTQDEDKETDIAIIKEESNENTDIQINPISDFSPTSNKRDQKKKPTIISNVLENIKKRINTPDFIEKGELKISDGEEEEIEDIFELEKVSPKPKMNRNQSFLKSGTFLEKRSTGLKKNHTNTFLEDEHQQHCSPRKQGDFCSCDDQNNLLDMDSSE